MSLTFVSLIVLAKIVIPKRSWREATGAGRDLAFRSKLRLVNWFVRYFSLRAVLFSGFGCWF
jgi:hypothetical protein